MVVEVIDISSTGSLGPVALEMGVSILAKQVVNPADTSGLLTTSVNWVLIKFYGWTLWS